MICSQLAQACYDESSIRGLVTSVLNEHGTSDERTFLGALFDAGLARVDYPLGHGGLGAEPILQGVVDGLLEASGRRPDWTRNPMGIGMCGPTIVAHGTEEQIQRFLRPIYTAEEIWCQLFSEPGSGSDVAGLSTSAQRDGDEWVISGQKVWTSLAHRASWGLLLARSNPDAPKHKGLTAFIIDMHEPGVEVRPLRQMSGAAEFNEVFFSGTRTPDSLRIGSVGDGWRVANATLMNERVSIGGDIRPRGSGPIEFALAEWDACRDRDPVRRDQLTQLWIEAEVLRLVSIRAQTGREAGVPGPEGSILKLGSALLQQRIGEFSISVRGAEGTLCSGYDPYPIAEDDPVLNFLAVQATTIAGGTSEVMRNILGERILGLPREPGPDSSVPWNRLPRNR